jgi:uncharacterized membrane protein
MRRLSRLLRHWRSSKKTGQRLIPASDLERIERSIYDSQTLNRFHVKVVIEVALSTHAVLRRISTRSRACAIFAQRHPHQDVDYRQIVIYINLADRRVEIINDPATTQLLADAQWRAACDLITRGFASGDAITGILGALHLLATSLENMS